MTIISLVPTNFNEDHQCPNARQQATNSLTGNITDIQRLQRLSGSSDLLVLSMLPSIRPPGGSKISDFKKIGLGSVVVVAVVRPSSLATTSKNKEPEPWHLSVALLVNSLNAANPVSTDGLAQADTTCAS